MNKKAVILVNVGTPAKPDVKSVRKYLFEFLNDRRVIDLPWLLQKILVNLIIVPFRAKKSSKLYQRLWTENGSPLLFNTINLKNKLEKQFDAGYDIFATMAYGEPSLKKLLLKIKTGFYSEIIFVPLFPHYASSTTGSVMQLFFDEVKSWKIIPEIKIVNQFYDEPGFIDAFASNIQKFDISKYDHLIFSFHGLPLKHIEQSHPGIESGKCSCDLSMPDHGKYCYKATCYETARLLAKKLNIPNDFYTVSFQSRLTKKWLTPFTDKVLLEKAESGQKNILIASPAFVADCLETIVELEQEYGELFKRNGGDKLTLVPSLNDNDDWVNALKNLIENAK